MEVKNLIQSSKWHGVVCHRQCIEEGCGWCEGDGIEEVWMRSVEVELCVVFIEVQRSDFCYGLKSDMNEGFYCV